MTGAERHWWHRLAVHGILTSICRLGRPKSSRGVSSGVNFGRAFPVFLHRDSSTQIRSTKLARDSSRLVAGDELSPRRPAEIGGDHRLRTDRRFRGNGSRDEVIADAIQNGRGVLEEVVRCYWPQRFAFYAAALEPTGADSEWVQ